MQFPQKNTYRLQGKKFYLCVSANHRLKVLLPLVIRTPYTEQNDVVCKREPTK